MFLFHLTRQTGFEANYRKAFFGKRCRRHKTTVPAPITTTPVAGQNSCCAGFWNGLRRNSLREQGSLYQLSSVSRLDLVLAYLMKRVQSCRAL
jgi:hypothetical protein